MRNLYTMAFAAAGLTLAASPAAAVTFTSTPGSTASFAAPAGTLVDFNGALPAGVTLTGRTGDYAYATGTSSTSAQTAFSDGSRYLAVYGNGTATLAADAAYQAISIFLGSIDSYNTVSLLSTTGAVLASYTGADLAPNANGSRDSSVTNRRITFTASAGETFGGHRVRQRRQLARSRQCRLLGARAVDLGAHVPGLRHDRRDRALSPWPGRRRYRLISRARDDLTAAGRSRPAAFFVSAPKDDRSVTGRTHRRHLRWPIRVLSYKE